MLESLVSVNCGFHKHTRDGRFYASQLAAQRGLLPRILLDAPLADSVVAPYLSGTEARRKRPPH